MRKGEKFLQKQQIQQTRRHCHVCRSPKDISLIINCSSGKRSHIFCKGCVERRLGESFESVIANPNWICPKCKDCCPCSKCRKPDAPKPTKYGKPKMLQKLNVNVLFDDKDAAKILLLLKNDHFISAIDNSSSCFTTFSTSSPTNTCITSTPIIAPESADKQQQQQQQQQPSIQQSPFLYNSNFSKSDPEWLSLPSAATSPKKTFKLKRSLRLEEVQNQKKREELLKDIKINN